MSVYFVYILETVASNGRKSYYTGYTNNLLRRLTEHRHGRGARYTRGKQKIELKYFESYTDRKAAMRRELEIKSFSKQKKLELIKNLNNS
ncbi:MAG: GIY-YIG nuclease family protein [Promethearchaeota archaeon]|nr:MAG: GIY-YIG nuclease family protein [Candidatus Lokiarchaeota archaeon]